MIKPLKYQKGGKAESQEQLVQLFQAAAENAQVDPQELVQKASELGQNEEAAAQFMQGLQLCAQGDPEGIKFIKSLFQSPAFRKGGKIFEFICKHAKGGYVAGCGCAQKAQDGASLGRPELRHIGELVQQDGNWSNKYNIQSNLYDYFGDEINVPTKEGAFRQGLEAGAAYNNEGEKLYSPSVWENLRKFHEETLPNSNRVEAPEGKLAGMENGGQVAFAQNGIPIAKDAKSGRRAAERNTVKVGDNGIAKRRRVGAAMDKSGGQHVYEGSTIRGNWADTWASVPTPGDTIVIQRIPVANGNATATRTYPMGSDEYNSVMGRLRPEFKRFNQQTPESILTPVPNSGLFPGTKRYRINKNAFSLQEGGQVDPKYKGSVSHGEDDYSSYETVGPLHRVIRAAYDSPTQLDTIIYAKGDRGYTSPYSRSDYWMDQAGIQQVDAERWKRLNQGFDDAKNAELDDLMNQAGFAKTPEKPQNQVRRGTTPPGWKGSR